MLSYIPTYPLGNFPLPVNIPLLFKTSVFSDNCAPDGHGSSGSYAIQTNHTWSADGHFSEIRLWLLAAHYATSD